MDKKIFENTYVTGKGRLNYLRGVSQLEDPLFTSFTFDIDYSTSPLFYTIDNGYYDYPIVEGMCGKIDERLKEMYGTMILGNDSGYDILPAYSASMIGGDKLGFGLQQNIYMDMPLYGATEYIYMVDKRNGNGDQNDVRHNSTAETALGGGNLNANNSYKMGESINQIISKSDLLTAEQRLKTYEAQKKECDEIIDDDKKKTEQGIITEHAANLKAVNDCDKKIKDATDLVYVSLPTREDFVATISPQPKTLEELNSAIQALQDKLNEFEDIKKSIVSEVNGKISTRQQNVIDVYTKNQRNIDIILKKVGEVSEPIVTDIMKAFVNACIQYCQFEQFKEKKEKYIENLKEAAEEIKIKDVNLDTDHYLAYESDNESKVNIDFSKYTERLTKIDKNIDVNKLTVVARTTRTIEEWMSEIQGNFISRLKENESTKKFSDDKFGDVIKILYRLMGLKCDVSDLNDTNFTSDAIKNMREELSAYETAVLTVETQLYGERDGEVDRENPTVDSLQGQYNEALEIYQNDTVSQAEKSKGYAEAGITEMSAMLTAAGYTPKDDNKPSSEEQPSATDTGVEKSASDPNNKPSNTTVPQTVLDMLGFKMGMRNMLIEYPYIIQSITGLDAAYNKHYGVKDPYMGSGDDKITLTCWESLNLRVSSMFNRYFNAVYDRQYRRERVPVNLRRFNCSVYVHDVRNFVTGRLRKMDNRIIELADMYYGVIEFRFYDCEIVPEETGNIFNDVSNEAPSEMKKTNFTFTYGNCVVNFVPPSEIPKEAIKTPADKKEEEDEKNNKKTERQKAREEKKAAREKEKTDREQKKANEKATREAERQEKKNKK